jgi:lipopolysaccharide/colanic/teichoic acid biosynthesis glycosyltransferase
MKRTFDVVVSVCAALVWMPVLTVSAFLVLICSGRPVFYRSKRVVQTGDVRPVVKFRTMVKNADKIANRETVPVTGVRFLNIPTNSPLYTGIGRLLERCGITELPQFVHVIAGHMSIVGNRPLPENVLTCLRDEYPDADDRFLSKAGLTGPAQLVGREVLSDEDRLRLEGAYCRTCLSSYSIWLDVSIIVRTMLIVVGVMKPMPYQRVLDLLDRQGRQPAAVPAVPAAHTVDAISFDIEHATAMAGLVLEMSGDDAGPAHLEWRDVDAVRERRPAEVRTWAPYRPAAVVNDDRSVAKVEHQNVSELSLMDAEPA